MLIVCNREEMVGIGGRAGISLAEEATELNIVVVCGDLHCLHIYIHRDRELSSSSFVKFIPPNNHRQPLRQIRANGLLQTCFQALNLRLERAHLGFHRLELL